MNASLTSPDARAEAQAEREGERALAALGPKLAAVPEGSVVRPSTDPQGAAATALLVADYLAQPSLGPRLASVASSTAAVAELRSLSRAILTVVRSLGGDYLPDTPGIPGDLVQRGQQLRASVASTLEKGRPGDADLQVWLEAIRLGSGVVDLVYDLRTLADLCTLHGSTEPASQVPAGTGDHARAVADSIEFALRTGDSASATKARSTLARLWTLFVPAYERAAAAARALSRTEGRERQFPALALVASHRRARRRPLSLMPSHAVGTASADLEEVPLIDADDMEEIAVAVTAAPPIVPRPAQAPPVPAPRAAARPAPAAAPSAATPTAAAPSAATPTAATPAAAEGADRSAITTSGVREAWADTRRGVRHTVEIEVGIASESNFYVGFTENLSAGGVFVATYVAKPLGSHVEVALTLPNGEELRVPGIVRWLREGATDSWPGMGVQFEGLSPEDEAKVRKFLSLREPMFYDE